MKRRRKALPTTEMFATIEKLSHDGRGLARIDGKATFIQGALAGEQVSFLYTRITKDYDEGRVVSVIEPSLQRVKPKCPHYEMCGGCSMQHLDEKVQIIEKEKQLLDLLGRVGHVTPETILAPLVADVWHYRNKARLSVRYVEKKQATLVGFREKNNARFIAEINHCAVINEKLDKEIGSLRQLIDSFDNPHCIAQVELAAGDSEVALIFRNLEPLTKEDENKLCGFSDKTGFRLYLQPGGFDTVVLFYPKDAPQFLTYQLPEEGLIYQFHPTDFTQVNASLNRIMIKKALSLMALTPDDMVLDLYCGLGNFSLPLAKHCQFVVGIEGSDTMVERATMNAQANQLINVEFFAKDLDKDDSLATLVTRPFTKALIDPPRSGALAVVNQIDKFNFQRILYVSCNPATLARDADILVNHKGYRLVSAGVMDMFSHTSHVESIALFEKE